MTPASPHPDFVLADQHDAEGRHYDAINVLARGTRAGSLACMTRLGKRLLTGDRAPLLAADGARFLMDAANRGDAEAADRIAALTALGLHVKQSWREALAWLIVGAERGWQPAGEQLQLLAGDDAHGLGSSDPRTDAAHWRRLGAAINFARWQTVPSCRELSADPPVLTCEGFIPAGLCDWIIARAHGRLAPALVYDPVSTRDVVSPTRTNTVAGFGLADAEFLDLLLQARMSVTCRVPTSHFEAPTVLHYGVGEENGDHYDFVNPATPDYAQEIARNGQRVLTFLVYLNDDYEGGETSFPTLSLSHKGRCGEGLFFVNALADLRPDMRMLHAGRATTRGEKWIISQFVRSRPVLAQTA
jgi:hypothetical protein